MEEGCNSEHQCSSFVQDGVKDEEFHNMDKVAPNAPIEAVPVVKRGDGDVAMVEIVLDEEAVRKLKVIELRDTLRKRGLSATELKAVLQTRLLEAVVNGVPILRDRPTEEIENPTSDIS